MLVPITAVVAVRTGSVIPLGCACPTRSRSDHNVTICERMRTAQYPVSAFGQENVICEVVPEICKLVCSIGPTIVESVCLLLLKLLLFLNV